jgi:plasmid replication initiation protein
MNLKLMTLENFLAIGDKYKEISSLLKRFVIAPAVERINTNTDFNIDISFRKCKHEMLDTAKI